MKNASRTAGCAAFWTALWATVTAVHCTVNTSDHPPMIGDCVPKGDASCSVTSGGGGAGSGPRTADAGTDVSSAADAAPDGTPATCGQTVRTLATASATCVGCVIGTLDANANCCGQDSTCGNDTTCRALVTQCLAPCAGNIACTQNCEAMFPQNTNFTDFLSCLQVTCSVCLALPGMIDM